MVAKRGLYANINAKKQRIKAGSGETMRKPGTAGAPTASEFQKAMKKKLRSEFSGLKFKNRGDGMTEISFN